MEETRKNALQAEITALFENEEFTEALISCDTIEAMHKVLTENGIAITIEEVTYFQTVGSQALKNASKNELTEADLEAVAGGGWLRKTARFLTVATIGAGIGFACGVCPLLTPHATGIAVTYSAAAALWVANG